VVIEFEDEAPLIAEPTISHVFETVPSTSHPSQTFAFVIFSCSWFSEWLLFKRFLHQKFAQIYFCPHLSYMPNPS
jgi:hypothetical protein